MTPQPIRSALIAPEVIAGTDPEEVSTRTIHSALRSAVGLVHRLLAVAEPLARNLDRPPDQLGERWCPCCFVDYAEGDGAHIEDCPLPDFLAVVPSGVKWHTRDPYCEACEGTGWDGNSYNWNPNNCSACGGAGVGRTT